MPNGGDETLLLSKKRRLRVLFLVACLLFLAAIGIPIFNTTLTPMVNTYLVAGLCFPGMQNYVFLQLFDVIRSSVLVIHPYPALSVFSIFLAMPMYFFFWIGTSPGVFVIVSAVIVVWGWASESALGLATPLGLAETYSTFSCIWAAMRIVQETSGARYWTDLAARDWTHLAANPLWWWFILVPVLLAKILDRVRLVFGDAVVMREHPSFH